MSSFVYLSKASKITNAPLLVMLHGYGSNEADLFSFASLIPSDYRNRKRKRAKRNNTGKIQEQTERKEQPPTGKIT
jgi:predicted esterase